MSKNQSSPERRAINQHLHRKHGGFAGIGSTENRMIQHEMLHAKGDCDHVHEAWDPDPGNFTDVEVEGSVQQGRKDRSDFIGRQ